MKTSVVLLALATAALAAPALHEEAFESEHHIPEKFLEAFTRERKSTLESSSSPSPGSPVNLPSTSQISEFGVSGRSFNLKKPIIIKKKIGSSYQVYRDSDEEKLNSPEPCRKQVRVNLCDEHSVDKSTDLMRSSTNEDNNTQMTEDDMKHSIMLAKEAVENLQKDLRKIDHTPAQTASCKHGDSESDVELHQDIEVARQALEHIHKNFDVMETSNPHDLTVKEAEVVEDVAFPLAQTEEERLAQWKEAIESIQRNVELVRNIEDSFKSTHDDTQHINGAVTSMNDKHEHQHELHKHSTKEDMRASKNLKNEEKHQPSIEHLEHPKLEKSSEQKEMITDETEKDMMESASMVSTSKLQELNHNNKARLTPELQHKSDHIVKAKDAMEKLHNGNLAVDKMTMDHLPQNIETMSLKLAGEKNTEAEQMEKKVILEDLSMKKMKESLIENQRHAEKELHGATTHMTLKNDEHATEMEDKRIEMKSAEHITDKNHKLIKNEDEIHKALHITEKMKQAGDFATENMGLQNKAQHMTEKMKQAGEFANENMGLQKNTPSLIEMKTHENLLHKDSIVEGKMVQTENSALTSDSLAVDQLKPMKERNFQMKAAEDMKNMQHQMIEQSHMRWAQDKNFNTEMGLMKSAGETHPSMDHTKNMHTGHHHGHQQAHNPDKFSHGHLRQHDHFMTHGKSADMDNAMQSNYFMNMRDSDNLGHEGQRFRWRPSHAHTHESARTAYGAAASSSAPASGAVGLFPNANVGGCGIPLLLSCNPSVVSGSLAKAHPAPYSAPAYRTEDDFNFHSKRDIKKTETLVNTLKRSPNDPILKTSNLVAKQ